MGPDGLEVFEDVGHGAVAEAGSYGVYGYQTWGGGSTKPLPLRIGGGGVTQFLKERKVPDSGGQNCWLGPGRLKVQPPPPLSEKTTFERV